MNSMIADNSDAKSHSLGYSFNFIVVSLVASVSITVTSMFIVSYGTTVIFPISIAAIIST